MTNAASVLLVDDDEIFRGVLASELRRLGFETRLAATGREALDSFSKIRPDVVLLDLRLPDVDGLEVLERMTARDATTDVIMLTGHGSIDTAIQSIRNGAFDYIAKPCPLGELEVRIRRALERQSLRRRATTLERALIPPDVRNALVGGSTEFRQLVDLAERVAATNSTVLVTGETGSGKEVIAKLLHAASPRRNRPFVVVECAALQESLLQSELFGHERGAFTGADCAKAGLFEVAHGGTLFLDEIGEISEATQVKLLRVLDTSSFRRVGGVPEIRVDVRIVAATNRDLQAMVRQKLFREDLYYRLSTITLRVPPLRDRRSDIRLLAEHGLARLNQRFGVRKRIGAAALDVMTRYDWPGNVRELLHAVESAIVLCDTDEIRPDHLPAPVRVPAPAAADEPCALETLDVLERSHIERVLRATGGHRGHAARILGISERNLYRKLADYGVLAS